MVKEEKEVEEQEEVEVGGLLFYICVERRRQLQILYNSCRFSCRFRVVPCRLWWMRFRFRHCRPPPQRQGPKKDGNQKEIRLFFVSFCLFVFIFL